MFFEDLNWMDVESYLQGDDRLIFVTGATEQHAYLSLLTDIHIPTSLAAAIAKRMNVLVAPPMNFGVSGYFGEYPGTISITQQTFDMVMTEVITGLVQQGFRRVLILNGHGGNMFPHGLEALVNETDGVQIKWHNWWQSPVAQKFMEDAALNGSHANWMENFPFTRVAEVPKGSKPLIRSDVLLMNSSQSFRSMLGDGSYGGRYQMPDEFMDRFFNLLVDEIIALIEGWK